MTPTVKQIQHALIDQGYSIGPAGADGIMGRATINAVKRFQENRHLDIKYPGTIGPITLRALGFSEDIQQEDVTPPWVIEARRKIGLHEQRNNKSLKAWLKSDGNTLGDPAKLPWCGDFMETCIALTLPEEPMVENPYWALNWKKFGRPVTGVALGAIAPFQREGGGHIGMVVGHDKIYFHILGGNQSNAVTISKINKNRLSGSLRWPSTYPTPVEFLPMTTIDATVTTNEA